MVALEKLERIEIGRIVAINSLERLRAAIAGGMVGCVIIGEQASRQIAIQNLVSAIKEETPALNILVMAPDSETLFEALIQGANGVVCLESLAKTRLESANGEEPLSPQRFKEFISEARLYYRRSMAIFKANITEREREVIYYSLVSGSQKIAAQKMNIELSTFKTHVAKILRKLKLKTMKEVLEIYGRIISKISGI